MPLDLSPLATPIIRNKIEEPSVVETTHQDSPLPHPESTTNDEKVRTLLFYFFFLEFIFQIFRRSVSLLYMMIATLLSWLKGKEFSFHRIRES